jgi:hypothetical protein
MRRLGGRLVRQLVARHAAPAGAALRVHGGQPEHFLDHLLAAAAAQVHCVGESALGLLGEGTLDAAELLVAGREQPAAPPDPLSGLDRVYASSGSASPLSATSRATRSSSTSMPANL